MGVAVLQPQDYLNDTYQTMRSRRNHNPNFIKSNRRKRSPTRNGGNNNTVVVAASNQPAKSLVIGQVKILKRGELLNESKSAIVRPSEVEKPKQKVKEIDNLALSTTNRFGPEPDFVPKKISIADFYAGSGFFDSPPPSSLPLPAFFIKKSALTKTDPTADLRRIIGLDLH